jgi:hydroxyacylglutathione hydrolase
MSGNLLIERFVNSPIASNCYLVRKEGLSNCLIVDPSFTDEQLFDDHILANGLKPDFIILTHEHFDHIKSVDFFRNKFDCKVIATAVTSQAITDPKKNLSAYFDKAGFACNPADILVEGDLVWPWLSYRLNFFLAPGHSAGGLCFEINNNFFVGDTIIKDIKTVVKLPGGSSIELRKTMERLLLMFNTESIILPGHGNVMTFAEVKQTG